MVESTPIIKTSKATIKIIIKFVINKKNKFLNKLVFILNFWSETNLGKMYKHITSKKIAIIEKTKIKFK